SNRQVRFVPRARDSPLGPCQAEVTVGTLSVDRSNHFTGSRTVQRQEILTRARVCVSVFVSVCDGNNSSKNTHPSVTRLKWCIIIII
uniref:Uncharacterized protein n=1 Tax=Anopheles dirus TaxID=7168 RepID=A0A182NY79_9DIPT